MRLKGIEMERRDELVHQLRHQINVRLVTASWSVEQLYQGQSLNLSYERGGGEGGYLLLPEWPQ